MWQPYERQVQEGAWTRALASPTSVDRALTDPVAEEAELETCNSWGCAKETRARALVVRCRHISARDARAVNEAD